MKKILLLSTLFSFLFVFAIQAQTSVGLTANSGIFMANALGDDLYEMDEMTVGLKSASLADLLIAIEVGANFASLTGSDFDSWDGRTGLHVGVIAALMFTEMLGIQFGLLYSLQGGEFSSSGFSSELNFDYLHLPILARIHLIAGLTALAGIQLGFLLAAESVDTIQGSGSTTTDIKDSLSSLDFALVFGAMYQIARFHVYLRYVLGLSTLDSDSDGSDAKNGIFQVGAGFALKK